MNIDDLHDIKLTAPEPNEELKAYMKKVGDFLKYERDLTISTNGQHGFLGLSNPLGKAMREDKEVSGFINMNLRTAIQTVVMTDNPDVLVGTLIVLFGTGLRAGAQLGMIPQQPSESKGEPV